MVGKVLVSVRYLARFPVWVLPVPRPAWLLPCSGLGTGVDGGRDGGTGDGGRETERRGRPLVGFWIWTSVRKTEATGW